MDAWLSRLPADAGAAFVMLRAKAHALASEPIVAPDRFAALEQIRKCVLDRSEAHRARYAGKPIPLADDERAAWEDCVGVWQAFYFGYALCTEAGADPKFAATIWQRALDSLGRAICEYVRAYRAVPASLWKEFNRCYRSAEDCVLDRLEVDDPYASGTTATCARTFLYTVLYDAANLYSLTTAQTQAVEGWMPHWLGMVELLAAPPEQASRSPLAMDITGESGARLARDLTRADTLRYLDTSALAPMLRDMAAAVRAGSMPPPTRHSAALARTMVERLLTHLYVQWCSAGTGRLEERRESTRRAQVAINMHAIHFQISGRAFRQPGLRYTREEEHDLATFGHITERTEHRLLTGRSSALEPWDIVNQSTSGLLGLCRKPDLETRLAHGQLVAMRTSSIDAPTLGIVQRLKLEQDGTLSIGVRVLRGEARGTAVRPKGDASLKYERALLVAADDERQTPAFLVVPHGKHVPGSMLEMFGNRAEVLMVTEVLDRSPDHDRLAFEAA
jgi:hypothetical protein